MEEKDELHVIGITQLEDIGVIDGGDTLTVRLRMADGRETALLVPWRVAESLWSGVAVGLEQARVSRSRRS